MRGYRSENLKGRRSTLSLVLAMPATSARRFDVPEGDLGLLGNQQAKLNGALEPPVS